MDRKYFGTDGVRWRANEVITPDVALKLGQAAGRVLRRGEHRHRAIIGKDTRLSGYMIENALVAGFTSVGVDVLLLGPIPTPAVAMLTRAMRADLGVMISASHNPFEDNGVKLFGPDGYKVSDVVEADIETLIVSSVTGLSRSADLGGLSALTASMLAILNLQSVHWGGTCLLMGCGLSSIALMAPAIGLRRRRSGSWALKL